MFRIIFTGIFVGLLAGGYILYTQFGNLISSGAETYGPRVLKVDVGLRDVAINPLTGEATISGFDLGQPAGFGSNKMVSLDQVDIKLDPLSLLTDHIKIDRIVLNRPALAASVKDRKTNFDALIEGLDLPTAKAPDGKGETPPITSESEDVPVSDIFMSIKHFEVRDPQLAIVVNDVIDVDKSVALESFTLTNLGTDEKGLAPAEIARHIMDFIQPQIRDTMVAAGIEGLSGQSLNSLKQKVEGKLGANLGGLSNALKKSLGKRKKTEN